KRRYLCQLPVTRHRLRQPLATLPESDASPPRCTHPRRDTRRCFSARRSVSFWQTRRAIILRPIPKPVECSAILTKNLSDCTLRISSHSQSFHTSTRRWAKSPDNPTTIGNGSFGVRTAQFFLRTWLRPGCLMVLCWGSYTIFPTENGPKITTKTLSP